MRDKPMTADEARKNISIMKSETPPAAMRRLIEVAVGPLGRLSDEARVIYLTALKEIQ